MRQKNFKWIFYAQYEISKNVAPGRCLFYYLIYGKPPAAATTTLLVVTSNSISNTTWGWWPRTPVSGNPSEQYPPGLFIYRPVRRPRS